MSWYELLSFNPTLRWSSSYQSTFAPVGMGAGGRSYPYCSVREGVDGPPFLSCSGREGGRRFIVFLQNLSSSYPFSSRFVFLCRHRCRCRRTTILVRTRVLFLHSFASTLPLPSILTFVFTLRGRRARGPAEIYFTT